MTYIAILQAPPFSAADNPPLHRTFTCILVGGPHERRAEVAERAIAMLPDHQRTNVWIPRTAVRVQEGDWILDVVSKGSALDRRGWLWAVARHLGIDDTQPISELRELVRAAIPTWASKE